MNTSGRIIRDEILQLSPLEFAELLGLSRRGAERALAEPRLPPRCLPPVIQELRRRGEAIDFDLLIGPLHSVDAE